MKQTVVFCFGLIVLAAGCGTEKRAPQSSVKEAWNEANNPLAVDPKWKRNFVELPLSGQVPDVNRPWADTYWPSQKGGIMARWYQAAEGTDNFSYVSPSRFEAQTMTMDALMKLSPAEKYDIFMGRFDYPTVKLERGRTSPRMASWEGICHGWAAAAVLHPEPSPVTRLGPSGIYVPFGSSDVKALLSYFEGQIRANAGSLFVGERCRGSFPSNTVPGSNPCKDANAGGFHVFLANQLGLRRESFVFDVTMNYEVWNQPAISYESKILDERPPSRGAAEGTVREVSLETKLHYTLEIQPQWQPVVGTRGQMETSKTYRYRLELDKDGNIIGGEWLQADRPDFLWLPKRGEFIGYWAGLAKIYQPTRQ